MSKKARLKTDPKQTTQALSPLGLALTVHADGTRSKASQRRSAPFTPSTIIGFLLRFWCEEGKSHDEHHLRRSPAARIPVSRSQPDLLLQGFILRSLPSCAEKHSTGPRIDTDAGKA